MNEKSHYSNVLYSYDKQKNSPFSAVTIQLILDLILNQLSTLLGFLLILIYSLEHSLSMQTTCYLVCV